MLGPLGCRWDRQLTHALPVTVCAVELETDAGQPVGQEQGGERKRKKEEERERKREEREKEGCWCGLLAPTSSSTSVDKSNNTEQEKTMLQRYI